MNTTSIYRFCDRATEYLLYLMIVFSPWAFGTIHLWSVWTMNIGGFLVGLLFFAKLLIRKRRRNIVEIRPAGNFLTTMLAVLTIGILTYCLISAANARATYSATADGFTYYECIKWLPHSYDSTSSWQGFWNYLALAFVFWGFRDWILTKDEDESEGRRAISSRLRRILWVLSVNGALIALVGLIQRAEGTSKLLWLLEPELYHPSDFRFGPYIYRGNGAQFLNLIWPVTLGFWWILYRSGSRRKQNNLLLPCVLLMATASLISLSRGGTIIAVFCATCSTIVLVSAQQRSGWLMKVGLVGMMTAIFAFAGYINGDRLMKRFKENPDDILSGRPIIYESAKRIAADFPLFGSGPETFGNVRRLYLKPGQIWYTEVHDDWLETRVTFGWLGFCLILAAFILAMARWFFPGGMYGHWSWAAFFWMAISGCLIHARFDFPLQVYSILFVFVLECAILFSLTHKK